MTTWIDCKTELPDDEIIVLVALEYGSEPVWLGFHCEEMGGWYNPDNQRFGCGVTHWAELPEPPAMKLSEG